MKPLDRISVSEKDIKVFRAMMNSIDSISTAIIDLSKQKQDERKKLWSLIRDRYPETKDFEISIDTETKEIIILNSKK